MKKTLWIATVPGIIAFIAIVIIIGLFVIKILWSWTIPDLFPGAVDQDLVAKSISWYTAFKLAIFLAVLAGIAGARGDKHHQLRSKNQKETKRI